MSKLTPAGKEDVPVLVVRLAAAVVRDSLVTGIEMTLDNFRESLSATEPPAGVSLALAGLWWDAKGDWQRAHESAQQDAGVEGAWVHAYLHRKEGDQGNAAYWYSRAGKPICGESLDVEWLSILKDLLG